MTKQQRQWIVPGLLAAVIATAAACGGSGSNTATQTENPVTTDTSATTTVFGSEVVFASATAEKAAASTSVSAKATGDFTKKDYVTKKTALAALMTGDSDCSFTPVTTGGSAVSCYGPTVRYCDHVESTTEDDNCVKETGGNNLPTGQDDGDLPSGDVGIWNAAEGTDAQACAAAQANYLADEVAARVDNAVFLLGAIVCAMTKAKTSVTTTKQDILTIVNDTTNGVKVEGLTISAATIQQLDDTTIAGAARPLYEAAVTYATNVLNKAAASTSAKAATVSATTTLTLRHSPKSLTDNTTFNGKITFTQPHDNEQHGGNCSESGLSGTVIAGTVLYEKASETSMTYKLDMAEYCGKDTDPFAANNKDTDTTNDNTLDPDDRVIPNSNAGNATGWANNWNNAIMNYNPSNGTGTMAYSWQAGSGDQFTRVLNIATTAADDGSASGTAYFGFGAGIEQTDGDTYLLSDGTSATDAATAGRLTGMWCNWAGPSNQKTGTAVTPPTASVQKQVLARTATGTVFTQSSSLITFAPTNDCNLDDEGSDFQYYSSNSNDMQPDRPAFATESDTSDIKEADNNHVTIVTVTNNLDPITNGASTFSLPTAPPNL
jgi:hypothetical protein